MKKKFWLCCTAVLLAAVMALSFAGCGSAGAGDVNVDEILERVTANQANVMDGSATMEVHVGISSPLMGETAQGAVSYDLTMDMTYKHDPMQSHMLLDGKGVAAGESNNMRAELYLVPDGDHYTSYRMDQTESEATGQWVKETVDASDIAKVQESFAESMQGVMSGETMVQVQELQKQIFERADFQAAGRERVGNVNALVLDSDLSILDVLEIMKEANIEGVDEALNDLLQPDSQTNLDMKTLDVPIQLRLFVDDTEMRIVKVTIDAKDALQQIVTELMTQTMAAYGADSNTMDVTSLITIDDMNFAITINGYGDEVPDVKVPQSVIDSAEESTGTSSTFKFNGQPMG